MDSSSCDQLPSPLQFLACDVKYPHGNDLIHQFVVNNLNKPSDSCSESDIRAALRSFPVDRANDYNEEGFTALHLAAMARSSFMVKMLLSTLPTIDVNARFRNRQEGTALHLAATADDFHCGYLKSINVCAALDSAVKDENLEIAKVLIERGASIDVRNDIKESPLHIAAGQNQIGVLRLLIGKGAALNAKSRYGWTCLHAALKGGHSEAVKLLVEGGAYVNVRDDCDNTPLHFAPSRNVSSIGVLELLIGRGATVNAKSRCGWTPLHKAVRCGDLAAVRVLVQSGAHVNERDARGNAPIHFAAKQNELDILRFLIRKGAFWNVVNNKGRTPLHEASINGCSYRILQELRAINKNNYVVYR